MGKEIFVLKHPGNHENAWASNTLPRKDLAHLLESNEPWLELLEHPVFRKVMNNIKF
jgi:hypothetical protein